MTEPDGLRFDGVTLRRGAHHLAADFALPAGQAVAVIGPSGAGKSTLLDAVAGFLAPETGRIIWQGRDLGPLRPGQRPVSILFQDNNLFPHLTIRQNLGLALAPNLRLSTAERGRIEALLARLGLDGLGDRRPGALSGGQQSRAALGRLLLSERPVALLDEPFSALGPGLRADMLDLARDALVAPGRLLLVVSHDMDEAARIADTAIVVAEGRAHPPAPLARLLADPPPALAAYLGRARPG